MGNAIIFPGQGCQTVGMGREFYDNFEAARNVFKEVDDVLGRKLTRTIFDGPQEELTLTDNAQPAIMGVSMAILASVEAESGRNFEDICNFSAGHSLGEYTALCASKSLTLDTTAKLLEIRGETFRHVGEKNRGSMAVIGAPLDLVEKIVRESTLAGEILEITNDNTDDQLVLSGNEKSLDRAIELAKINGIGRVKKLAVAGAFHSKLMEPAVKIMREALENVEINEPKVSIVANYTAEVEDTSEIKNNLLNQITNRVRWRETMINMEKFGVDSFLELGPSRILGNMVRKTCPEARVTSIASLENLKEFLKTL
ncbi:MAG: ACP S-malonyltransferase [Rickettsiales bacterium]|jgi:[acyl-carrier-protein] S-malonyltransferase|nr:ACP S-malonyltransferase [Rickettsiales bacterium]